jgi:Alpha/beta hydrolase domain
MSRTRATALLAILVVALSTLAAPGQARVALPTAVPAPELTTPPDGVHGHPLWDSWHQLEPFGYQQREYLVSGTAEAAEGSTAPYTTRVVVFRPRSQDRFNGTVLLDWVNVTAQFENAVDILEAREMLLREGYAFVHVSAQSAGLCCTPLTPKVWDPVRYEAVSHPGDAYAADIFAQVAQAVRAPAAEGPDPLGPLTVRRVIASGQSQSANRLYGYVSSGQAARDDVIDGFLIHGGGEKTFEVPLATPVLHLLSDLEADPSPPSDDPRYRLWEVAATAHSDYFIGYQSVFGNGPRTADQPPMDRDGYDELIDAAGNYGQDPAPLHATCTVAGATMPMHYAVSTALHQLDRWVRTGEAPPITPRFAFDSTGQLAKDRHGNTRGGIRMPPVEVPVATYLTTACGLGGITVPFTDAQLQALYPTFADYQLRMKRATDRAVRRGWLLPPDARDQMRRVCTVRERYPAGSRGQCRDYQPPVFGSA